MKKKITYIKFGLLSMLLLTSCGLTGKKLSESSPKPDVVEVTQEPEVTQSEEGTEETSIGSIYDLFEDPHGDTVKEAKEDLDGDGIQETIKLEDLGYCGGDGGYDLQVFREKDGKEIKLRLPSDYDSELGFPFTCTWNGDGYEIGTRDTLLAKVPSSIVEVIHMQEEIETNLNSYKIGDTGMCDAVSGFKVIEEDGKKVLAVKSYISGLDGHCDSIGYGITKLKLNQDDTWETSYEFLLDLQDNQTDKDSPEEEASETEVDYSDCFKGFNGCAVFYSPKDNVYNCYNTKLCKKEISPCSTFKIMGTLMGFETGVLTSKDTKMGYDGTSYTFAVWNDDLTLEQAFQTSCVWYFRKVMNNIGQKSVADYVNAVHYGNCDISEWKGNTTNPMPDLNGFWLGSSLKISAKEQVEVLNDIFTNHKVFSEDTISSTKEIMRSEDPVDYPLYGKTGTGKNHIAWYTGFFELNGEPTYFAVNLQDKSVENLLGSYAKETAEAIIEKYYM